MTGPAAVMPQAPSLPSVPAAKISNSANAIDSDTAEFAAFSELLTVLSGEPEAPRDPERQDEDAPRDEGAGQMPLPLPMLVFPEKTPQARFAEELSATLPPGFAQGSPALVPPALVTAEPLETTETPRMVAPPVPPVAGKPSVQPSANIETAPPVSALPGAAPEPAADALPVLSVSAPAVPVRGPQEHGATKALPENGSAAGEPLASSTATAGAEPLAPSVQTATSEDRPAQDGERGDTARTIAAFKEAKVSAVQQETHFAPAPSQSPAFQIANRIVHEVDTTDPVFTAQPVAAPNEASAPPVKVLFIKLDPPELGALTIRMSLKDDMLHLQIEASRYDTARLVERDQDALSGMLRSAGYTFDGLTVQVTTGDRGNGAQQFSGGSGFNQAAGQNSAGRQPENSDTGQGWQRGGEPERIAENGRETEGPGAPGRRGGTVYL